MNAPDPGPGQPNPGQPNSGEPDSREPDSRVVGLAREVERTTRRLAELETLIRRLGEDVAVLADAVTTDDQAPPLRSWLSADDPAQARADLAELADWLARVYLHYPDAVLPSCWAWHPALVEELWWLRHAHHAAYHGRGGSWREVGDWHDRQRPGVLRRARALATGCELALHSNGHRGHTTAPTVPLVAATEAVAEAWATSRTTPAPTTEQLTEADQHDRAQHRSSHR